MSQNVIIALIVLAFLVVQGVTQYLLDRRRTRRSAQAVASLSDHSNWKVLYEEECRKRKETISALAGALKERDGWKDIFWQCSKEHGVAQEYMVRINQHFAKICKRDPDAAMPAMRKAFEERYGEAGKAKIAERIARGEPPLELPQLTPSAGESSEISAGVLAKTSGNA